MCCRSDQIVVQPTGNVDGTSCGFRFPRYNGRPALWWKSVSGWRRAIHHSHSRPILASSPCCCYTATLPLFRFSLRISVVLSHHLSLADRRTDGRLSRVRNAPFLFFTSRVLGDEIQVFVCFPSFLLPRPCENKTAATKRIDASRCKFVLFFTTGHPATAFASPCLVVPANKGFPLQRRRSELDRLFYFI